MSRECGSSNFSFLVSEIFLCVACVLRGEFLLLFYKDLKIKQIVYIWAAHEAC